MGLETATYINQLNPAFPLPNDFIREADDHMRLIKSTLQNTFPNITSAVTATHAELNLLVGQTGFPGPGGIDTHIQFNVGGLTFGGSSNLTFDGTTINAAAITVSGLLLAGGIDVATDVAANTLKLTNATHTGQVLGSGALFLDITAVTAQPAAGVLVGTDTVIINDGGVLSEATMDQIATFTGGGGGAPILTTVGDILAFQLGETRKPVGADGTVLTADSGQSDGLNWVAPAGGGGAFSETAVNNIHSDTLSALTTGNHNFLALDGAGSLMVAGFDNIAIGQNSGAALTNAIENIFMGISSGLANQNGSRNIAIGPRSFTDATSSAESISMGMDAGRAITSGNQNIAIGSQAMGSPISILTGLENIAIGTQSMAGTALAAASRNISIGGDSSGALTSGTDNIAIGQLSLNGVTSGDGNVMLGFQAGLSMTGNSNNNVCIGENAAFTAATTYNNQLIIHSGNSANNDPLIGGDFNTMNVTFGGSIRFSDRADHILTPTNGFGEQWLRSINDGELMFTDETGTDFLLSAIIGPVGVAVTGSRASNSALASLLTNLATLGLITDSSTA